MATNYKGQTGTVRVIRACDLCKRKKKKCAGPVAELQDSCLRCIQSNAQCTFLRSATPRGHRSRTITEMQDRIHELESLIAQLDPRLITPSHLPSLLSENGSARIRSPAVQPASTEDERKQEEEEGGDWWDSEGENASPESLSDRLAQLRINPLSVSDRFGGASSVKIAQHATRIQHETSFRLPNEPKSYRRPEYWSPQPLETSDLGISQKGGISYTFPEPGLLQKLLEAFFSEVNSVTPVLHRPTFLRDVERGLHHHDTSFAELLLCVCACSAYFTDDPRVLLSSSEPTSGGCKWFYQVGIARKTLPVKMSLHEMQALYLSLFFLYSSSVASLAWTVMGTGIRWAQELYLHRKKTYKSTPNADDEQWKRVFWLFAFVDRGLAIETGRGCALNDQDIDAPLPIECDDEYWEGEKPFEQPVGIPSRLTAMLMLHKLKQIEGHALRTIAAVNKAVVAEGPDSKAWERTVLAQLNSDLNSWLSSVPSHLKWESQHHDPVFFKQSAHLHINYYSIIIGIHRPFLLSIGNVNSGKLHNATAFAVCSNAARSSISIIERFHGERMHPIFVFCMFNSAVVLLLTSLVAKRSDPNADVRHNMLRVEACFRMLQVLETTSLSAGRFRDLLTELASKGNVPLSRQIFTTGQPRSNDSTPAPGTCQESLTDRSRSSDEMAPTFNLAQAGGYSDMFGTDMHSGPVQYKDGAMGQLHTDGQREQACFDSIDEQLAAIWQDTLVNEGPPDWQSAMQALQWSGAGPMWYEPSNYEGSIQ